MTHVGLIYGGLSSEHEVSVRSARNVFAALDRARYRVTLIRIDRHGRWHVERDAADGPQDVRDGDTGPRPLFSPMLGPDTVRVAGEDGLESLGLDVVFPMLHGQNGEDGRVQGLLQTLGLPYVGPDVLGSAVCMDKEVAKRLMRDAGLPVVPFRVVRWGQMPPFGEVTDQLGPVLFVKPANSGSSVGTSKAETEAEYQRALDEAFHYDRKALIETAVTAREVECAVIGNESPEVGVVGEIVSTARFYTYDAKYEDPDAARMQVPADLPGPLAEFIRQMAADAYRALGCEGLARVDFFVTDDHKLYINEVNTLPGFTERSMFPLMFERAGKPIGALVDELIRLALERHTRDARLKTSR